MKRGRPALLAFALAGCQPTPATPAETPDTPEPSSSADGAEPTVAVDPEPETIPAVAMVNDGPYKDLGFMRGEPRPDAPLLRATKLEPFGERGDALAHRVVGEVGATLACFEAAPPSGRAWLNLRIGLGGDPESMEVQVGPDGVVTPELQRCLAGVFEPMRVEDASASGAFSFELFPRASEATNLPAPRPGQKAAVRYGGACFVWVEQPPCPPKKRCYADRWEPSMCPHRADRDGVWSRHDLDEASARDGWARSTALELVDADGQPIWRAEWTVDEAARLPRFDTSGQRGGEVRGYIVDYGVKTIRVADHLGVREYDRTSGARVRAWLAPKSAKEFFVDSGTFRARGKVRCEADTDHGSFAKVCGRALLYFNGYTFAVLDAETLEPRGLTNLDAKSSSRKADGADIVAKLNAWGVELTINGIIYMD